MDVVEDPYAGGISEFLNAVGDVQCLGQGIYLCSVLFLGKYCRGIVDYSTAVARQSLGII